MDAPALRAAIERINRLHQPVLLAVSSPTVLCSHCCIDDDGQQSVDCATSHQHTAGVPACATAKIIAQAEEVLRLRRRE